MLQLALNIHQQDEPRFENFYPSDNQTLVHRLKHLFDTPGNVYLWSTSGNGRSHLLQATCHFSKGLGKSAMYLSFKQRIGFSVDILKNLTSYDLVCLDDLGDALGDPLWEEALFHLYNEMEAENKHLVIAAHLAPHALDCLADLRSRLAASTIFQIHPLNEAHKLKALEERAQARGLELSNTAGKFLLNHFKRDNPSLFGALDLLDRASLAHKQALTIPFIKRVLGL